MALHGALARGWRASLRGSTAPNRRRRAVLWAVWVLKWPVLGTVLWLALRNGWVSAGWLCVGVGLTPGVIVMMAAAAAVGRRRGERAKAGA